MRASVQTGGLFVVALMAAFLMLTTAQRSAGEAVSMAEDANANAEEALSAATSAQEAAETAQEAAEEAQSTADEGSRASYYQPY
jgi:hypothetical protein